MPDGVLVAGADGQVVALNAAGARMLGMSAEEAAERDFLEVMPLVDSAGRNWWACTDPYGGLHIRTGQPERLLEVSQGPATGRQLLVCAKYVRDGQKLTRLVISFRGATSRERVDREQANLVATVAHEIRSPLTGVKGFTATLLAKWDRFTDEQKRTMLTAINADADRVTRLLSDLLDVSRIDAGRCCAGGWWTWRCWWAGWWPPTRTRRIARSTCGWAASSRRCGWTRTRSRRLSATCWTTRFGTAPAPSGWS